VTAKIKSVPHDVEGDSKSLRIPSTSAKSVDAKQSQSGPDAHLLTLGTNEMDIVQNNQLVVHNTWLKRLVKARSACPSLDKGIIYTALSSCEQSRRL
jgi:hypothetical protein